MTRFTHVDQDRAIHLGWYIESVNAGTGTGHHHYYIRRYARGEASQYKSNADAAASVVRGAILDPNGFCARALRYIKQENDKGPRKTPLSIPVRMAEIPVDPI